MMPATVAPLLVFSTYVEVIPVSSSNLDKRSGILHVCGGDPQLAYYKYYLPKYSPRMWR